MESRKIKNPFPHRKWMTVIGVMLLCVGILVSGCNYGGNQVSVDNRLPVTTDSAGSVAAFNKVYDVLMSPRCMNCHPAGDIPLQGDDSHIHAMMPRRGKDGKGLYAMKCSNCHQPENAMAAGAPPGNP